MSLDESKKMHEMSTKLRFIMHEIDPDSARKIINYSKKIIGNTK